MAAALGKEGLPTLFNSTPVGKKSKGKKPQEAVNTSESVLRRMEELTQQHNDQKTLDAEFGELCG